VLSKCEVWLVRAYLLVVWSEVHRGEKVVVGLGLHMNIYLFIFVIKAHAEHLVVIAPTLVSLCVNFPVSVLIFWSLEWIQI
jgi:hypothetical protein